MLRLPRVVIACAIPVCTLANAQDVSVYVPARDGTRLAVDVYLPKRPSSDETVPALVELTRYWRGSENARTGVPVPSLRGLDRFLLGRGFALVKVDVRGTGASFGTRQTEYGPEEVRDGHAIVDWIVKQPWSSGKVGAYGTSYTGTTAELLAAVRHPAVRAVVLGWSDYDLYTSPVRPYGLFAGELVKRWSTMVGWMDDNNAAKLGASVRRVAADRDGSLLRDAVAEHGANADVYRAVAALDYRDTPVGSGKASLAECSSLHWKSEIEKSGVAMLVLASWLDAGTADGALRRFLDFDNPQNLVILASSHGGGHHASPYTVGARPLRPIPSQRELAEMRADFFDQHLRGEDRGVGKWPKIRYFNMGEEAFHETEVWPPKGTHKRRFWFAEGKTLSRKRPKDAGHDDYDVDYGVTTGRANRWMTQMGQPVLHLDDRAEMDARMLTYTTPPLTRDLQITGTPVITLHVTSNRKDGAFLAYLEDVDAKGKSRYVTEGGLRAIHRKLGKNPRAHGAIHRTFARADAAPLVPGKPTLLRFELWPTSVRIRAGHRLRIAIAGADAGSFDRVPADGSTTLRVGRGEKAASFIELPVVE